MYIKAFLLLPYNKAPISVILFMLRGNLNRMPFKIFIGILELIFSVLIMHLIYVLIIIIIHFALYMALL